jgi:hypothetical protein
MIAANDTVHPVISLVIAKHIAVLETRKHVSVHTVRRSTCQCQPLACTCAHTIKVASVSFVVKSLVVLGCYKVIFARTRGRNHLRVHNVLNVSRTNQIYVLTCKPTQPRNLMFVVVVERHSHSKVTCTSTKNHLACAGREAHTRGLETTSQ